MAPKKQIHINFFEMCITGAHMGVGQWKTPGDQQHAKDTLEYYQWLAKLADKGKISCIFFADVYGVDCLYENDARAAFETAAGAGSMDPMVLVAGMASVTKNVSFGITGSTTYLNPYILARTVSTLDHITNGRFAWNVVTSYSDSAAKAMGKTKATSHDRRYEEAHEYMDLVYSLWEGSWEDGSKVFDTSRGIAYDYDKAHRVTFEGNFHNTDTWAPVHPSLQRTPVLFQAGASKAGSDFAAKHAEAIFCGTNKAKETGKFVKKMRALAVENGRDPNHIKFFPGITPVVARTVEEAEAKYQATLANVDYRGGLAKMSSYLGVDFSKFPLDQPFDTSNKDINGVQTMLTLLLEDPSKKWTPRMIGAQMAFCGFGPMPVGTPEIVADVFEEWVNDGDIDGFNVAYITNPTSYEDIVELLVPVLQERGIMWKDYAVPGGTFRENLLGEPGQKISPPDHPSKQFTYEALKKLPGVVDEKGDIHINRRDAVPQAKVDLKSETVETVNAVENLSVNGTPTLVKA